MANPQSSTASSQTLSQQIADALERLTEVLKHFLIDTAKSHQLSALQLQILWTLSRRPLPTDRTVKALAQHLGIRPPTISESLKILQQKGYVTTRPSPMDGRSQIIELTPLGTKLLANVVNLHQILAPVFSTMPPTEQEHCYETLLTLIAYLQRVGIIEVQRLCFGCRFYRANINDSPHYCQLLQQPLQPGDLRLDCPDYEQG